MKNIEIANYGSYVLKLLKKEYGDLFLSIELPKDEISISRKNFYLRNGFIETFKTYEDTNVEYEILSTSKTVIIDKNLMNKRYSNMTDDKFTLNKISQIFNTKIDKINLIK